jgi:cellulose synthase operon protein B
MLLPSSLLMTAWVAANPAVSPALAQDTVEAAATTLAETPDAEVAPDEAGGTRTTFFGEDFFVPNDLMLQGITAKETVNFPTPEWWDLQSDPVVDLQFNHSGSISPRRSSLSLRINGIAIASTPLDETNVLNGVVRAVIPRDALRPYNELKIEIVQHVDEECEDPFDPVLWTRVSRDSAVIWDYQRKPASLDLAKFPLTVYDPLGYGPMDVALAGTGTLSEGQLEAIGILGFSLGRDAAYRYVNVQPPVADLDSGPPQHVLVIGTPAENPLVSRFVDRAPGPGEGLVKLAEHPRDPRMGVVVVTGGDAEGLRRAAQGLAGANRREVLSGSTSIVDEMRDFAQTETHQDPLPAPHVERFTLGDLDIEDRTVRGYYAPPITIPLRLEGDAETQIEGARVGIDYAYSAHLDTRLSTMEVRLDGVTLRSVGLDDPNGEEKQRLYVDLPFELVEPATNLEIVYHLFPNDFNPCVYITDRHIWATVFSSSRFDIARDHYAMLPDLGLLKYDLWPYGVALEDEGVTIVTADQPDMDDGSGALQIAAELGRRSVAARPRLHVVPSRSGTLAKASGGQQILLVGDTPHSTHDGLARQGVITQTGVLERKVTNGSNEVMGAKVGQPYGSIEQALSTSTVGRTVLVVRSPDRQGLSEVARTLQDDGALQAMKGNAAMLSDAGVTRSVETVEKTQVGVVPLRSRLMMFARGAWWLLGLGVLIAALLLTLIIRAWASMRGGQA